MIFLEKINRVKLLLPNVELRHPTDASDHGRKNREWKPPVAYCRCANDFLVEESSPGVREECRTFLEGTLKLELNIEKPISPS